MLLETALADFSEDREWRNRRSVRSTDSPGGTPVGSPAVESSKGVGFHERKRPLGWAGQSSKRSGSFDEGKKKAVVDSPGQFIKRRSFLSERSSRPVASPDLCSSSSYDEGRPVASPDQSSGSSSSNRFNDVRQVDSPGKYSNSFNERTTLDSTGQQSNGFSELGPANTPGPSSKRSIFSERRPVDPPSQSSQKSSVSERRLNNVLGLADSGEEEELHLQEEEGDIREVTQSRRSQTSQFYGEQGAGPFEWEASPRQPIVKESLSSSSRCNHPVGPLRVAEGRRAAANPSCSTSSPVRSIRSPPASVGSGIAGRMKSVLGGTGPKNVNASSTFPQRAAPDWSGTGREDVADRDSDDGSGSSPVSTLDLPLSPLSPTCSPTRESGIVGRHAGRSGTARPANHLASNTFIGLTEMSEELPSVMEEDEEDLESVSGFHTIEFQTMESPSNVEDRGDWSLTGRAASSQSLSAPNSRQTSSLRPGATHRGRRRSDFDWPEDFDERPEEVVKEVDDSLWAFSPVASTFVFSGNETIDHHRSPSVRPCLTGVSTPASSPGSGSVLEHLSLKRNIVRSAFSKTNHGLKSSADVGAAPYSEYSGSRRSSRFRHYSVNGDDDYLSSSGHPTKKSFSCLPFFSLCSAQRPTPTISFSQRLSPTVKN